MAGPGRPAGGGRTCGPQLRPGLRRAGGPRPLRRDRAPAPRQCLRPPQAGGGGAGAGPAGLGGAAAGHLDVRPAGGRTARPGQPAPQPAGGGERGQNAGLFRRRPPGRDLGAAGGGEPARRAGLAGRRLQLRLRERRGHVRHRPCVLPAAGSGRAAGGESLLAAVPCYGRRQGPPAGGRRSTARRRALPGALPPGTNKKRERLFKRRSLFFISGTRCPSRI